MTDAFSKGLDKTVFLRKVFPLETILYHRRPASLGCLLVKVFTSRNGRGTELSALPTTCITLPAPSEPYLVLLRGPQEGASVHTRCRTSGLPLWRYAGRKDIPYFQGEEFLGLVCFCRSGSQRLEAASFIPRHLSCDHSLASVSFSEKVKLLQEKGPPSRPETGLLSNTRK